MSPFIYSIQKPKRELYLGLSIALLVLGSVFLFAVDGWKPAVNPFVALVTSGLISTFLWIVVRKTVQVASARPTHDLELLMGLTGEARSNIYEEGSVYVAGEMWSARSNEHIPAGSSIRVVRREGFILVFLPTQFESFLNISVWLYFDWDVSCSSRKARALSC